MGEKLWNKEDNISSNKFKTHDHLFIQFTFAVLWFVLLGWYRHAMETFYKRFSFARNTNFQINFETNLNLHGSCACVVVSLIYN